MKDSERRAKTKYRKKLKFITVHFAENEQELYEYVKAQKNMTRFVKGLIEDSYMREVE